MNFAVFLGNEAAKFLENLDTENKYRIVEKLKLHENVHLAYLIKNQRSRNTYRIRIGDFRVIYSLSGNEIRVLKIGLRSRIYKKR